MNFIIKLVGAAISRRIESGSSKGAWIGAVIGGLGLGGLAGAGWATGATGFMGVGLMIAGTLFGAIVGALIGAGLGPEDRLITSESQTSVSINDYNRKLVAMVPFLAGLGLGVGSVVFYFDDPQAQDAQFFLLASLGCAAVAIGSLVYLLMQDLTVTLRDDVCVNRLLGKQRYTFSDIQDWQFISRAGKGTAFPAGRADRLCAEIA